ncbi:MAG: hypothetical protein U1F43_02940 [Myxococcota bacterium]
MSQLPRLGLLGLTGLATALGLGAAACHDNLVYDPTVAVGLDTRVEPGEVGAGERANVTCVRVNGHGEPLAGGQFVIGVDPVDQSFVDGTQVFANQAGTHHVACSDLELGLLDDTPADLVVDAGPPVSTRIALDPSTVPAGAPSAVTCQALDAHGNVTAANLRVDIAPTDTATVDGTSAVSATHAGDYAVTCYSAAVDEAARGTTTLTVVAGPRAGIALQLDPVSPAYGVGQGITVIGVAVDEFGNIRQGDVVPIQDVDATPPGHHNFTGPNNEKIRFDLEDRYVVSAAAVDDPSQTASVPLVVDETRPVLTLTSPPRALVTDTLDKVTVSGTVSDNLGQIASLTIAGHTIALPPAGGPFSYDLDLAYGLTLIDIHAVDTQGFETLVTRAVEQGKGGFRAMTAHTFEQDGVANAAALVLTQDVFDDGDHDEPVRDDLASIVEYIVKNLDFKSFVPDPLTTFSCIGGDCSLRLTSVTMGDVNVTIQLQPGRIHLQIELVDFAGQMTLFFPCDIGVICATPPTGALPATFQTDRVTLTTDLAISVSDGQINITSENTVATIDGLTATVTGDPTGILQGALTGTVELLRTILLDALEGLIVSLVEDQVAGALGGLFGALSIDQTFDVPSPVTGGAPNTIALQLRPKGVDIASERLQLRVDGLAYAKNPVRPHPHLGSLRHSGCAPEQALTWPPPSPITVGLHDDLINELLFAIWEGGTVSLDLTGDAADSLLGQFGMMDSSLRVDALLPPVFESCAGHDQVQLGELYLDVQANFAGDPIHLGLWLLADAPIDVDLVHNEEGALQAKLVVGDIDPLWIEVVINEGPFADDDSTVVSLVRDTLIPRLLGTVSDSATFTLPAIDLGSLTSAVPAGTTIDLDIQSIARDNAYLTINASLK